jgi:hypothetical protein
VYTVRSKLADTREDERGFILPELMVNGRIQTLATQVALRNRGG